MRLRLPHASTTLLLGLVAAMLTGCSRGDHGSGEPIAASSEPPPAQIPTTSSAPTDAPAPAPKPDPAPSKGASSSGPTPASVSAQPEAPRAGCASAHAARTAGGHSISCYPYRCRNGACLKGCVTSDDCAPFAQPGEPLSRGWPLKCAVNQCVPLPPERVLPPPPG